MGLGIGGGDQDRACRRSAFAEAIAFALVPSDAGSREHRARRGREGMPSIANRSRDRFPEDALAVPEAP